MDPGKLPPVGPENTTALLHDSFALFLKGAHQRVSSRMFRSLGTMRHGNEGLDTSVKERLKQLDDYRPANSVQRHLHMDDVNLDEIARLQDLTMVGR